MEFISAAESRATNFREKKEKKTNSFMFCTKFCIMKM